jgi:hypothetical protein
VQRSSARRWRSSWQSFSDRSDQDQLVQTSCLLPCALSLCGRHRRVSFRASQPSGPDHHPRVCRSRGCDADPCSVRSNHRDGSACCSVLSNHPPAFRLAHWRISTPCSLFIRPSAQGVQSKAFAHKAPRLRRAYTAESDDNGNSWLAKRSLRLLATPTSDLRSF